MPIKTNEIPFVMGQKVTATIRGEVFNVCVRGWMRGQYVIIDLPKVAAEYYRVAPQTGVQIHFIKDGTFVNFKTSASYALAQAISLLVIEYPRKFDMHNLRKFERFKIHIPVNFSYEESGKKFEDSGTIWDISSSGALMSHTNEVDKSQTLLINAELPTGGIINMQMAEVKNCRKNPKSETTPYVTGIKWKGLLPEVEAGIYKFLARKSKDRSES